MIIIFFKIRIIITMNEALEELMNYYENGGVDKYSVVFPLEYFNANNDIIPLIRAIIDRIGGELDSEGIIRKGDVYISMHYYNRNSIYLEAADNINIVLATYPNFQYDESDEYEYDEYESDDYDY